MEEETKSSMELDNLEVEMSSEETAAKRREYEELKLKLTQCDQEICKIMLFVVCYNLLIYVKAVHLPATAAIVKWVQSESL